ncbi:MAG: TauD/TfdA family dioxygenase [Phyllobacteriaceae bacterium]|nr:TauD/TfdA family dioxygenase [Phyllobacteriaceae bacterium]
MTITDLAVLPGMLAVTWTDGTLTRYPTIWLRDNCPSGLHPQTQERTLDLLSLDHSPELVAAERSGPHIGLRYADGHLSTMPVAFLDAHRPGMAAADAAALPATLWRADLGAAGIPRHGARAILADDAALHAWLADTAAFGLSIVEGLDDRVSAGTDIAGRIGFLRRTNFGTTFEVVSKPDPNNLAYTSVALPLHTDLPNQEVPPGYQFLHCLANEAQGGGSVFADGFAIAADLRAGDPEAFRLLSEIAIPFRFHDEGTDISVRQPVLTLDGKGDLIEVRFNAHIAGVFDMPSDQMPAYYGAYRAFMARTRDPAYRLTLKLKAGEMVVFDNRRVLHGREAFDPSTGHRHLHGCYVDRGEFASRLRVLARGRTEAAAA